MMRTLFLAPVLFLSSSALACGMLITPSANIAKLEVLMEDVDEAEVVADVAEPTVTPREAVKTPPVPVKSAVIPEVAAVAPGKPQS